MRGDDPVRLPGFGSAARVAALFFFWTTAMRKKENQSGDSRRTPKVAILCLLLAGCSGARPNAGDQACIDELAHLQPVCKLDNQGRVMDVTLDGAGVGDKALDSVRRLPALRRLSLYGSSVTDAGVAKLKDNRQLESLGLGATCVTDAGLVHL